MTILKQSMAGGMPPQTTPALAAKDAEIGRLRAEAEKDRVDAERYRWLRDRAPDEWGVWRWIDSNSQILVDDSSMDREIDAAMGEGK